MDAVQAAESVELAAMSDLYAAAATSEVAARRFGQATLLLAPSGPPMVCNRLLFGQSSASMSDGELDALTAELDRAEVAWSVSARPDLDPSLLARLAGRGFRPGYAWMKFARGTEPLPTVATPLRIEEVGAADGQAMAAVIGAGFGMGGAFDRSLAELPGRPGWHCFLAWHERQPVAAAVCYVRGDAAWLGMAATLPSFRRWGAHRALIAARIDAAAAAGARQVFVETGERVAGKPDQSYRNLLRMGFRELYRRDNLLCPDFERRAARIGAQRDARRVRIG